MYPVRPESPSIAPESSPQPKTELAAKVQRAVDFTSLATTRPSSPLKRKYDPDALGDLPINPFSVSTDATKPLDKPWSFIENPSHYSPQITDFSDSLPVDRSLGRHYRCSLAIRSEFPAFKGIRPRESGVKDELLYDINTDKGAITIIVRLYDKNHQPLLGRLAYYEKASAGSKLVPSQPERFGLFFDITHKEECYVEVSLKDTATRIQSDLIKP